MKTLIIKEWKNIDYPKKKLGIAEIDFSFYSKGVYRMEGVRGYEYFEVKKRIKVTELKINKKTVMVNDPLHWIGMEELARHSTGKVCVAGLGLGLIVWHLVNNKKVTEIDVYEINKDVINLVSPLLPKDKRLKIIEYDFFKEPFREKEYDTIILDLWVGEKGNYVICGTGQKVSILGYYMRIKFNAPRCKVFVWGVRDSEFNPAVKEVRKS